MKPSTREWVDKATTDSAVVPPSAESAAGRSFNELSVLFPLLSLYTAGYLGLMMAEFFLHAAVKVPAGMMPVYVALLGAYAADKEIRRWAGTPEPSRRGTVFVHLWMVFFLVAWLLRAFRPEFQLPAELGLVVLQVLGIFFGSKASKYIWEGRRVESDPATVSRQEDQVLELIRTLGQVKNQAVADLLGVSSATAKRLLGNMADKGIIRKVGDRKATVYEAMTDK